MTGSTNPHTVAFIPVRCGSKSIPFKNIKPLNGRPLVYWVAAAASHSSAVDEVVVATDCNQIAAAVTGFELPKVSVYWRRPENATHEATTESVMLEYLDSRCDLDNSAEFVLLQATSPLTRSEEIDEAIDLRRSGKYDSVLSVVEFRRFIWDSNGRSVNYDWRNRPRRQDFQPYYLENGAIYVNTVAAVRSHRNRLGGTIGLYVMPYDTAVELDEPDDWRLVSNKLHTRRSSSVARACSVKLLATDVDGVLTDSGMYYGETGEELKKFNTRDGLGLRFAREAGIKTAVLTSEDTYVVARRAEKLGVDIVRQGVQDKLSVMRQICEDTGIPLRDVAFVGDEINDVELLSSVGFAACPADAAPEVKAVSGIYIASVAGGDGVLREVSRIIACASDYRVRH